MSAPSVVKDLSLLSLTLSPEYMIQPRRPQTPEAARRRRCARSVQSVYTSPVRSVLVPPPPLGHSYSVCIHTTTPDSSAQPIHPPAVATQAVPPVAALSTAAWALASARFLTSPCLPFCQFGRFASAELPQRRMSALPHTHRPLRKLQVLLAPALSQEPLILLQAAAHGAGGDSEVAVVAGVRDRVSPVCLVTPRVCPSVRPPTTRWSLAPSSVHAPWPKLS